MSRSTDILFMAEYIKNVLYFATVREGRTPKSSAETHYFCIDDELVYENYYSDFGPLNLGCVYKYCKILNDKLKQYFNKQKIVHYTSIDPKKKANAAFVLGCYGVLYLSLQPRDALKPLMVQGQSYRPFQDATQGDSSFTISLMDCLQAMMKAKKLGFFNFQDFNCEDYERLDKIQGGDLNWIVPGRFLAFIGPVDYSVSLYHPPEMYIDYFLENDVKIVIRLNKRLYDGNVFSNAGINHYDLFFPDGSCPPRHILMKFLQISEESDGAIAVHCKAGLGRTGSLIGCYLIKHYRMTSHEAIGWMRICRPGSVIGHQQAWLEQLEVWLIKQGNLYRKRLFNDTEKFPYHKFGVYSITEKTMQQRPVVFHKSLSPAQPVSRQTHSDIAAAVRPQASRVRDAANKTKKEPVEQCHMRSNRVSSLKVTPKGKDPSDTSCNNLPRRGSGAGEPRPSKSPIRSSAKIPQVQKTSTKLSKDSSNRSLGIGYGPAITTFRTTNGPVIKNVADARNFLLKSSMYREERDKQLLMSAITVTPRSYTPNRTTNYSSTGHASPPPMVPSDFTSIASRGSMQLQQRRRLGRSPSPQPISRMSTERSRATNTPPLHKEKPYKRDDSKSALREALSRLKLTSPRDRSLGTASVGAASLGARRDAPTAMRAPSVRSDERPLATQGDLLNSIKFQRRLRDALHTDKLHEKFSNVNSREKPIMKIANSWIASPGMRGFQDFKNPNPRDKSYVAVGDLNSRISSIGTRGGHDFKCSNSRDRSNIPAVPDVSSGTNNTGTRGGQDFSAREKSSSPSKHFVGTRPSSPKARRNPHSSKLH